MKEIRKIDVGRAGLFGGVLAGVFVLVFAVAVWILEVAGVIGQGQFLESVLGITIGTLLGAVVAALVAALSGGISGLFYAVVYNIVASITGGLRVEID